MKLSQLESGKLRMRIAKAGAVTLAAVGFAFPLTAGAQAAKMPELFIKPPLTVPDTNSPISAQRTQAHRLFRSLTGVTLPIDDSRLKAMETLLAANKPREAAAIATNDALFYQNKVRDLARKMSNRDEYVRAPMTDFVATFVGIVRDSDTTSAKEMLTGNFTYEADPAVIAAAGVSTMNLPMDPQKSFVDSNDHYAYLQAQDYSLKAVLKRVDGQKIDVGPTGPAVMSDAAGLITTRGFMQAHADAGTNRRLVEYSFREFMCAPITEWADGTLPDDRIGRDVDRMPGGTANKFLTSCKNCHAGMDALRGAFAHVDWNGQHIRFDANPGFIAGKYSRNAQQYPAGYVTKDDSFVNYSTTGKNKDAFGWRQATTGNGMAQFGAMLANSQGFSRCMVKRVFETVCNRSPLTTETPVVRSIADQFESSNYHMRGLFEIIALRPECGIN